MGALVDIAAVQLVTPVPPALAGFNVERPRPGQRVAARAFELSGWAIGHEEPVVAVEAWCDDRMIQRVPVRAPRPDLAAAFGDSAGARAGFETSINGIGRSRQIDLGLRVELEGGRRLEIGRIQGWRGWRASGEGVPLVSVIIAAHRGADLDATVDSVIGQGYPHVELIIVGGPGVSSRARLDEIGARIIAPDRPGIAASRNAGLRASSGDPLVFLDAGDRLVAGAIERGLRALRERPECGSAWGRSRGANGSVPLHGDAHIAMLDGAAVPLCAVIWRRAMFEELSRFDPRWGPMADRDAQLRASRDFSVHDHAVVVVEHRAPARDATAEELLRAEVGMLRRHRPNGESDAARRAWKRGLRMAREAHGPSVIAELVRALRRGDRRAAAITTLTLARHHRAGLLRAASLALPRRERQSTPTDEPAPSVGRIRWGHFDRTRPVSTMWGFDRGTPVDRVYIEDFLARWADDVRGDVLEVGDDRYARRFGRERVGSMAILGPVADAGITVVADLGTPASLPEAAFDCVIATQVIHLVHDIATAVDNLTRSLRSGGVLLITVPGILQLHDAEFEPPHWALTPASMRTLLERAFPAEAVTLETRGNVLAAVAMLHGIAAEEIPPAGLAAQDATYPVSILVRAVRPMAPDD